MLVVAEPPKAGEETEELLSGDAGTDLDRNADDRHAVGRDEARQRADDAPPLFLHAMFENFHAGHDVPRLASSGGIRLGNGAEPNAGQVAEPSHAFGDLPRIDVDADRFAELPVDHRDERAVAAAVVEETASLVRPREFARELEAAAMAPRHDAARAVDLLSCVIAVSKKIF